MSFVFPQIKGLGSSWMAEAYAISSKAEADAYLAHPVLGPRVIGDHFSADQRSSAPNS